MHWLHLLLSFWRFWSFLLQVIMKHFLQTLCCRFHLHYFLLYFLFYVDSSLVLNVSQLYLTNCACLLILLLLIVGPTLRNFFVFSVFQLSHGVEVNVKDKDGKLCLYANLSVALSVSYEAAAAAEKVSMLWATELMSHLMLRDLISATALLSVWNAHELFF